MEYLLLTILIIALISIYINFRVRTDSDFDKVVLFFLFFVSFHVLYTLAYQIFNLPRYVDAGFPFGLVYGPVVYFALRTASRNTLAVRKVLIHLIPFFVWVALFLVYALFPSLRKTIFGLYYFIFLYSLVSISMIFYVSMALFSNKKHVQSELFKKTVRLVTIGIAMLLLLGLLFLALTLTHIIPRTTTLRQFPRYIIYTAMLIQVSAVLRYQIGRLMQVTIPVVEDKTSLPPESDGFSQYQKSLISETTMDLYERKLDELIKEKVFQDTELTLESLGKQIGAPKHHLTQLLNLRIKKTFNQYINELRVQHACSILTDDPKKFPIEKLAFECGFNSKASFNRNFKIITGYTPSEYKKRC